MSGLKVLIREAESIFGNLLYGTLFGLMLVGPFVSVLALIQGNGQLGGKLCEMLAPAYVCAVIGLTIFSLRYWTAFIGIVGLIYLSICWVLVVTDPSIASITFLGGYGAGELVLGSIIPRALLLLSGTCLLALGVFKLRDYWKNSDD